MPFPHIALFTTGALLVGSFSQAADDRIVADFEGPDYAGWKVEGEAFGVAPAQGALSGQMDLSGFLGRGLVNSFVGGDGTTGRLVSPPFAIERPYINFLIGGGAHPDKTCINLRIGDQVVRTSTGPNEAAGGSENLEWTGWDVHELRGQTAVLEIVDAATGGWGHINIDHIVQSDSSKVMAPQERTLTVDHRYLLLPVKTGAPKLRVQAIHQEQPVQDFEIELAEDRPDFWVACDLEPWRGQEITLRATKLPAASLVLERLRLSDTPPSAHDQAIARPEIHFTAPRGWLNDPNGLVAVDGTWHLFYQHNPYGWNWGNMHWGHATSLDLLHWHDEPIALTPRKFGDWAFSGSAVVDSENTSGWKTGDAPLLVGAYTSTGRGECIVYSNDHGQTWTEFDGNPVVEHQGRDPRLLWHAPSQRWVMAVYDELDGKQWIAFYNSPDLKTWTFTGRIEGYFECPDLFELPVDGNAKNSKWVLYAANGEYALGQFDGKNFNKESGKHRLWHGNFYAAQTFSNAPDGRRIQIGWGQGIEFPGEPFNQQMVIPVELTLKATEEGPRMTARPVLTSKAARQKASFPKQKISGVTTLETEAAIPALVAVNVATPEAGVLRCEFWGEPVVVDFEANTIKVSGAPPAPFRKEEGQPLTFRVVVDHGSLELFTEDGLTAVSARARPLADSPAIVLIREAGQVTADIDVFWDFGTVQ